MAAFLIGALAADATEVAATIAAGDAAMDKLDLEAGIAAYRGALEAAPESYEATWKLVRALTDKATLSKLPSEQKGLCVEAEKLARKAVGLSPSDANGHAYLAVAVGKLALFEGGKRKVELSKEVKAEAEKALQSQPRRRRGPPRPGHLEPRDGRARAGS